MDVLSPDWLKSKYHGKNYGILSIPGSDLMFLPGSGSGSGFEISLDQNSVPGSRIPDPDKDPRHISVLKGPV